VAEHATTILGAIIAAMAAVGGLLIALVRSSAAGEREARKEALQVMKEAAKENAAEAARNRDAETARNQRILDGLNVVTASVGTLQASVAGLTTAIQMRGASGRSGQLHAVRDDERERR